MLWNSVRINLWCTFIKMFKVLNLSETWSTCVQSLSILPRFSTFIFTLGNGLSSIFIIITAQCGAFWHKWLSYFPTLVKCCKWHILMILVITLLIKNCIFIMCNLLTGTNLTAFLSKKVKKFYGLEVIIVTRIYIYSLKSG